MPALHGATCSRKTSRPALIPTHGAMAAVALDAARDLLANGDKFRARRWLCDAIAHTREANGPSFQRLMLGEIRAVRASIAARAVA